MDDTHIYINYPTAMGGDEFLEGKARFCLEYDLSPSLEDYLEEIYRFSLTQPSVRVSDLSGRLKVSSPSVSKALQKLRSKEFITYHKYGYIYLTDWGNAIGKFLVERNAILQEFLFLIGARCNIGEEAEAMEHYLSLATIESIQALVDFMRDKPEIARQLRAYIEEKDRQAHCKTKS